MRSTIFLAAALVPAMLLPCAAFAFETNDAAPAITFEADTARFSDPREAKVLPELSLEAYGRALGNLHPNYIPEPPAETPGWFYSSPAFRSSR